MLLADFLMQAARDPRPWNCSTTPADWCMTFGHPDFAAAWRDVTEHEACERVQTEAGTLVRLWESGIGDGLAVVSSFEAGDIAVLSAMGLEAGGIFTGDKWAFRSPRGISLIRWPESGVLKAWRP